MINVIIDEFTPCLKDAKTGELVIKEYKIDKYKLYIIKGLGLIKINGDCSIKIHSLKDVRIYESEIKI